MKIRSHSVLLLLIVGVAFFLRVHGINYHSYGDEHYHVYNSLGLASGQLPGNFHRIALFIFYGVFYALGWVIGIFSSPYEFIGTYFSNMHVFYYAGRFFESLLGTAGVVILYGLGKNIYSQTAGLIAALFLAVSPLAVEISQIARGQALCLSLLIAAMYFIYPARNKPRKLYLSLFSGLCFGAAVSIRAYAAVVLIPLGYFLITASPTGERHSPRKLLGLILGFKRSLLNPTVGLFILGALLTFLFSTSGFYDRGFEFFSRKLALVDVGASTDTVYIGSVKQDALRHYLAVGFPLALGYPLYILSGLALLYGVLRFKRRLDLVFSLTVIFYVLVMGRGMIGAYRYLFPILPILFLLAGDLIVSASGLIGLPKLGRKTACLVIVLLAAVPAAGISVQNNRRNRQKTTMDLSREWIFSNLPPGSRIAVESMGYRGPDLKLTPVIDYWIYNLGEKELAELLGERLKAGQPSIALKYFIDNPPAPKFHTDTIYARQPVDIAKLKEERYQYIVTCSGIRDIYETELTREKYPDLYSSRQDFYSWLESEGTLIREFSPAPATPGEKICIYQIPVSSR